MAKYRITWQTSFTDEYEFDDDMDIDGWAYDCPPDEELNRGDWKVTIERLDEVRI